MANPSKMKVLGCFLFISLLFFSSLSLALTDAEAAYIARRQILHHQDDDSLPNESKYEIDTRLTFANPRLKKAYIALHALKKAIYSDPQNFTANWEGPNVCAYNGVFCAQALDDPKQTVVAGVDLNHADIAGYLPIEIGHLADISLLHLNSNRFCGIIPKSIVKLNLLFELDVSNNRFVGPFPEVVLELPSLKYLDLRYNDFEGPLPSQLFNKDLDALFLNNNRFHSIIPKNLGNSTVSVLVLSNNKFHGCIPKSIGNMANTLNELLLSNNELSGCLPEEITLLKSATVFDISNNKFVGDLPVGLEYLQSVEAFDAGHNVLKGKVPESLCSLPNLQNLTFSNNFFEARDDVCEPKAIQGLVVDDTSNCFANLPHQRSAKVCWSVLKKPVDCSIRMQEFATGIWSKGATQTYSCKTKPQACISTTIEANTTT
jgi:hypothetical protein